MLIKGSFYLNQQNGIINPTGNTYNQGMWHRDLPYQHFTSSSPLGINALYCVDDFTIENGSTFVLPSTHKVTKFPSEIFVEQNAKQITAKAGSYIVLDCMIFHSGGINNSSNDRRAVNHVFTIPHIKKQIDYHFDEIPSIVPEKVKSIFDNNGNTSHDINEYLEFRQKKNLNKVLNKFYLINFDKKLKKNCLICKSHKLINLNISKKFPYHRRKYIKKKT